MNIWKRILQHIAYFQEYYLWPFIAIGAIFGPALVVYFGTGRSASDDLGEISGVAINQAPVAFAAFFAVLLDGHLYNSLKRQEWLDLDRPFMDSAKPLFVFAIILIFEYFYLRH